MLMLRRRCPAARLAVAGVVLAALALAPGVRAQGLPPAVEQALQAAGVPLDRVGAYAIATGAPDAQGAPGAIASAAPVRPPAPIAAHNASTPLNPASTMKVVTTYAALSTLGPAYRWRTAAYLRGRVTGDVLEGDLVLRGGGDPKLVIEDMTAFVERMRQAGLREIRGDLLIDASIFDVGDYAPLDGDAAQPYNVGPHALLMNFKSTKFVFRPHAGRLQVTLDPPLADVVVDRDVRLVKGPCRHGAAGLAIHDGAPGTMRVRVSGAYSVACGEQATFAAVLDHRRFIHGFFKAAWTAAGGVFTGRTRFASGAAQGTPWLEWVSPRTLGDVVLDINKFSNNVMARQLLLQIAAERAVPATTDPRWAAGAGVAGAPSSPAPLAAIARASLETPAPRAAAVDTLAARPALLEAPAPGGAMLDAPVPSASVLEPRVPGGMPQPPQAVATTYAPATPERASAALQAWLARQGMAFDELVIENGSGLSRRERISASHLAQVLRHAASSAVADTMRESLPLVGVDGTMKKRLVGDPVAGHAWIKTGSLNDVRAIAGYVDAASGRRYAIAMIVNDERAEAAAPAALDAFIRWVYEKG